jgi:hypothetical protein
MLHEVTLIRWKSLIVADINYSHFSFYLSDYIALALLQKVTSWLWIVTVCSSKSLPVGVFRKSLYLRCVKWFHAH